MFISSFSFCLCVKLIKNVILKPSKYLTHFPFPPGQSSAPSLCCPSSHLVSCVSTHFTCFCTDARPILLDYHLQYSTLLLQHKNYFLPHPFQIPLVGLETHYNLSLPSTPHTYTHIHTLSFPVFLYYIFYSILDFFFTSNTQHLFV